MLGIFRLFLLHDVAMGKNGRKIISFEGWKEGLAKYKTSFWFMNSCCVPLKELFRLKSLKKKNNLEDLCAILALEYLKLDGSELTVSMK